MAKIKTPESIDAPSNPDTPPEVTPSARKSGHAPDSSDGKDQSSEKTKDAELPSYVTALLKAFRGYPALYIDSHGGAYTTDTAEKLRPGAALYKNPFYEP